MVNARRCAFITKANQIHHNRYNYDNVDYVDTRTKVEITCPKHGLFFQKPYSHLAGHKCIECGLDDKRLELSIFLERSTVVHHNKYNYAHVRYHRCDEKIIICCPIHGNYSQTPIAHMTGAGCKICYHESMVKGTATFIIESNIIHNNKYSYNDTNYVNTHKHVDIRCPIHGIFSQQPNDHLQGRGCRKCGLTGKYSQDTFADDNLKFTIGHVYFVKLSNTVESFFKIGITINLTNRIRTLSTSYNCELLASSQQTLYNAYLIEQHILLKYSPYCPQHRFSGHTECMELSLTEVEDIETFFITTER